MKNLEKEVEKKTLGKLLISIYSLIIIKRHGENNEKAGD